MDQLDTEISISNEGTALRGQFGVRHKGTSMKGTHHLDVIQVACPLQSLDHRSRLRSMSIMPSWFRIAGDAEEGRNLAARELFLPFSSPANPPRLRVSCDMSSVSSASSNSIHRRRRDAEEDAEEAKGAVKGAWNSVE